MAKQSGNPLRYKNKSVFAGNVEYVDTITGAIVGSATKYKTVPIKQEFVTMYLNDENIYPMLAGLGSSGKVLGYILKEYNDKTGMFYFSMTRKEMMKTELKLSLGTIRSCVKDFHDSGLLIRISGSEYMVNPHVFYKGLQTLYDGICKQFDDLAKIDAMRKTQKRVDKKTVKV